MAEQLDWSQLLFRVPICFAQAGQQPTPNFLNVILRVATFERQIKFMPIRRREADATNEWYVHSDSDQLQAIVGWATPLAGDDDVIAIFPLANFDPLTVGETSGSITIDEDMARAVQITGGSLTIPISGFDDIWAANLACMWPTGQAADVTHIHLEPAGVFLQGASPRASTWIGKSGRWCCACPASLPILRQSPPI